MAAALKPSAIKAKLKKWVDTINDLSTTRSGLPVTRLLSLKTLCPDQQLAQEFALFISERVQQTITNAGPSPFSTPEQWQMDQEFIAHSIDLMRDYLADPSQEKKSQVFDLLSEIRKAQGDDIRRVHGRQIHFVRSGTLLQLEYALRCFTSFDYAESVYQLGKQYVEKYNPSYGSGIIPESAPLLMDVAAFWCQALLGRSLHEVFPNLHPLQSLAQPNFEHQ